MRYSTLGLVMATLLTFVAVRAHAAPIFRVTTPGGVGTSVSVAAGDPVNLWVMLDLTGFGSIGTYSSSIVWDGGVTDLLDFGSAFSPSSLSRVPFTTPGLIVESALGTSGIAAAFDGHDPVPGGVVEGGASYRIGDVTFIAKNVGTTTVTAAHFAGDGLFDPAGDPVPGILFTGTTVTVTVPEPRTLLLVCSGALGLWTLLGAGIHDGKIHRNALR